MGNVGTEWVEGQSAIKGLAFFYCDGNSQQLASDSAIIFASILRQLLTQCFSETRDHSLIDAVKSRFPDNMTFSKEFVLSSLKWIADFFSEIFIVIDGADECSDRDEFCESVGRLVESNKVRVLVASRPEHDIATADVFREKLILDVDDSVKNDISTHVSWYIEKDRKLRQNTGAFKEELIRTLVAKSDGMCPLALDEV